MSEKSVENNARNSFLHWSVDLSYHYVILNMILSDLMMQNEMLKHQAISLNCGYEPDDEEEYSSYIYHLMKGILRGIDELEKHKNDLNEPIREVKQSLLNIGKDEEGEKLWHLKK